MRDLAEMLDEAIANRTQASAPQDSGALQFALAEMLDKAQSQTNAFAPNEAQLAVMRDVAEREAEPAKATFDPLSMSDWGNKVAVPMYVGANRMLADTVLGGGGLVLGNVGAAADAASSAGNEQIAYMLQNAGIPEADISAVINRTPNAPAQDNMATRASKWLLERNNDVSAWLDDINERHAGENPHFISDVAGGIGSTAGFMLGGFGAAKGVKALGRLAQLTAGALTEGGMEALTEAGGVMTSAHAQGKYNEGLSAANKDFLTNMGLNAGLNLLGGRYNPYLDKIPGFKGFLARLAGEIGEEALLQEPLQGVIESAANKTLENRGNFFVNLWDSLKEYPEILEQVGPSTAASTAITQGGFAMAERGQRRAMERERAELVNNVNRITKMKNAMEDAEARRMEAAEAQAQAEAEARQGTLPFGETLNAPAPAPEPETAPAPTQTLSPEEMLAEVRAETQPEGAATPQTEPEATPLSPPAPLSPPRGERGESVSPESAPTPAPEPAPAKPGKTARVRTAKGTEVDVTYRLKSADELITSDNADYPQEVQPRQRDRAASQRQVEDIANKLDPTLLGENRMASDGAPIIGPDGVVESGNGRVMAIRRAYQTGKAEAYQNWLKENAGTFGLSEADFEGVNNPVLVRERTGDVDRARFAREANEATVAKMSRTEQAMSDAKKLTPAMLGTFDPDREIRHNRDFIETFARDVVGTNEMGGFMDSKGRLSQEGEQRVRDALFAAAYGDAEVLSRVAESLDNDVKTVTNALIAAAPRIAAMESAMEAGGLRQDLSIKGDLAEAVKTLEHIKAEDGTVEGYLIQGTLDPDMKASPETRALLNFFNKNRRSAKAIAEGLTRYAELVQSEGSPDQVSMFGEDESPKARKTDLMRQAFSESGTKNEESGMKRAPKARESRPEESGEPAQTVSDAIKEVYRRQIEASHEDYDEETAEHTARVVIAGFESEAKSRGISVEDVAREAGLVFVSDPEGKGLREKTTRSFKQNGNGTYQLVFPSDRYSLASGASLNNAAQNDFVLKDGKVAWGQVTEELSNGQTDIPVGEIRVVVGNEKNGLIHAKAHDLQFIDQGFSSAEEFIEHTLDNFNLILPIGDGKHFIAYDQNQKTSPAAVLAWREGKGHYDLITAFPANRRTINRIIKKSSSLRGAASSAPTPASAPSLAGAVAQGPENNATVPYGDNDSASIIASIENEVNSETYQQSIGRKGAAALDKAGVGRRMEDLSVAREMEQAGSDAKAIRLATGWERDAAGDWRFEIMDGEVNTGLYLNELASQDKNGLSQYTVTLGELYDAPELYAAYSDLEYINVRFEDRMGVSRGAYIGKHGGVEVISIDKHFAQNSNPKQMKEVLVHEIQHAIQDREGFARGGNPEEFTDYALTQRVNETFTKLQALEQKHRDAMYNFVVGHAKRYMTEWIGIEVSPTGTLSEPYDFDGKDIKSIHSLGFGIIDGMIDKRITPSMAVADIILRFDPAFHEFCESEGIFDRIPQEITDLAAQYKKQKAEFDAIPKQNPWKTYLNLAGEVDARNASTRMDMSAEERRNTLLAETEDVAREDQIILREALGISESRESFPSPAAPDSPLREGATDARAYTRFEPEVRNDAGEIVKEARTIIGILKNADRSSPIHELGHVFLERMRRMAQMENIPQDVKDDWKTIEDWLRLRGIDFSKPLSEADAKRVRNAQEKWAAGWEKYFASGKAPNSRLQRVFERFKQWMKDIYGAIKNITYRDADGKEHRFNLPKNVREVMDRMLTPEMRTAGGETEVKSIGDLTGEANERIEKSLPPKEDPRNLGAVAPGFRPEIDPKKNPNVQTADAPQGRRYEFENPETEARYNAVKEGVAPEGRVQRIAQAVKDFAFGLKGDFPLLAGNKQMNPAKETLRRLNREKGVAAQNAVTTLRDALKGLSAEDFDLFARKRLLDDLTWRKQEVPDAKLPFGFTDKDLANETARFEKLIENNERVKKAIEAEEAAVKAVNARMISLADKLGWTQLRDSLKNPHYFRHQVLDFAQMRDRETRVGMRAPTDRGYLKRYKGSERDINANYIQAHGEGRALQMQDITMLEALVELKEEYDISERINAEAKKSGKDVKDLIPEGYARWTPFGRGLVFSADTAAQQALDAALIEGGRQLGIPFEGMLGMMDEAQGAAYKSKMWIIPADLAATLNRMGARKERTPALQAVKEVTSAWKNWVLYNPMRLINYNIRNITGDMDAVIAGNPRSMTFVPQAMRDLTDVFFKGRAATGELHEFQQRGGALTTESVQELYDWKQMREFQHLMDEMAGKDISAWKKLGKDAWSVIDKYWKGAEALTNFREQTLRYATYLSYLEQMKNDAEGKPANWGASDPDEVMSVKDIRDRAFKMANELLGAYDQVSQTGQQLRDIAIPFYSWLEVNAKRYYRLLKNGFTSDDVGDFAARLLKTQAVKSPLYAYRAARTILTVNLFSWAIQAFNRFVMGDEDDDLTPDVRDRPHITLGRTADGRVLYFDRIGATADVMDWFSLDSFWSDARDILNGQQTVTGYLKKMASAPFSKALNALNPAIKMSFEIPMGRTIYPDMGNPRTIRDVGSYIASSLGLTWEYRAAVGAPGPKYFSWDRLRSLFTYSQDAQEGAYFYILDRKREFQERALGKSFDGFAVSKRGNALRRLKTALRFKDQANVDRALREYAEAGGTRRGLKASMENMDPLHGLNKQEKKRFLAWLSGEDRRMLDRAMKYYREMRRMRTTK